MEKLQQEPWARGLRIVYDRAQSHDCWLCVKILSADATREKMLSDLMSQIGVKQCVRFGSNPDNCDVIVHDADKDWMVKELKRRFEPVDLRGWKNIFRLG